MEKKDTEGPPGEGESTPGSNLSREEVMRQRAEKKKLKEARKNKSGAAATPGGGGDSGTPDQKQQTPKPKKAQQQGSETPKNKNPQQQQKKQGQPQQPQASEETPKSGKGPKPQQKSQPSTPKVDEPPVPEPKSVTKPPEKNAATQATPIAPSTDSAGLSSHTAKSETPERSTTGGTKSSNELQSTIQSLFQVKKSSEQSKNKKLHLDPLFHSLGVKLRHNVIRGTNQRCVALLNTIKDYVKSYQTPSGMSFKHGLSADLQQNMDLLRDNCPFAIGMNNAVDFLNAFLYKMDQDVQDINQKKEEIMEIIDQYIEEKIEKAVEAIVYYGKDKVVKGDVIMVYSITDTVLNLLAKASAADKDGVRKIFELIIIQTPETILDLPVILKLLSEPIKLQTVKISSVSFPNAIYRMRHCTKVIIGGHGLFTTGGVMAQSGSGQLALLAATFNKPTIFLCETYKFCDRSPLDFFTLDEYVAEQAITQEDLFQPKIKYDVTPANLVTVVVTDIDLLPSTSVPVVLRLQ